MSKAILKVLIGMLLIAGVVFFGGQQYYAIKQEEYRTQLESTINEKHLEGGNAIGAFYYDKLQNDSISVYKVSSYDFGLLPWLNTGIGTVSFWGGQNFDYANTITKILRSGEYEWYDFKKCATTYRPFMIIVKKTSRGYDIIGEYILGIGLTHSYPNYSITKTSSKFNWGKLSNYKDVISYNYKIKADIIDSYIKNLFEKKYNGITIRNEVMRENSGIERNVKFDMLNDLVMKGACPADSSLYFRVNKYFELKFDDAFTTMGSHPIVWQIGSYGNYTQTVFTNTVTMHYSIQENDGVLKEKCKSRVVLFLLVLEALYVLLLVIAFRKKFKI